MDGNQEQIVRNEETVVDSPPSRETVVETERTVGSPPVTGVSNQSTATEP